MSNKNPPSIIYAILPSFSIDLPYVGSEFRNLVKLGTYEGLGKGINRWTFPLAHIADVQTALGGRIIQYDKEYLQEHILPKAELLLKELEVELNSKGKGTIMLSMFDDGYNVSWFQAGKKKNHPVSKDLVHKLWFEVFSKYDVGKQVKSARIWEDIVKCLEKHHWDDEPMMLLEKEQEVVRKAVESSKEGGQWKYQKSGKFNSKYFFGDRKNYTRLFYTPVKVLVAMGLLFHSKDGTVTRLRDQNEFVEQAKFTEMVLLEKEAMAEYERVIKIGGAEDIKTWERFGEKGEAGQVQFNLQ